MKSSFWIWQFLVCTILISCAAENEEKEFNEPDKDEHVVITTPSDELREYYFPTEQFADTVVYHYLSKNGKQEMYWVMNSVEINNVLKFNTTVYTPDEKMGCRKIEFVSEDILTDGSHVTAYSEYKFDGASRILEASGTIKESLAFKWNQTTTEHLTWSAEQTIKENPAFLQQFSKTRSLISTDSTYVLKGDTLETAVYKDDIHIEVINQISGKTSVSDFYQYSYYAQNTGMVRYVRTFQDNTSVEFYLNEIIDVSTWRKRCAEK